MTVTILSEMGNVTFTSYQEAADYLESLPEEIEATLTFEGLPNVVEIPEVADTDPWGEWTDDDFDAHGAWMEQQES